MRTFNAPPDFRRSMPDDLSLLTGVGVFGISGLLAIFGVYAIDPGMAVGGAWVSRLVPIFLLMAVPVLIWGLAVGVMGFAAGIRRAARSAASLLPGLRVRTGQRRQ